MNSWRQIVAWVWLGQNRRFLSTLHLLDECANDEHRPWPISEQTRAKLEMLAVQTEDARKWYEEDYQAWRRNADS